MQASLSDHGSVYTRLGDEMLRVKVTFVPFDIRKIQITSTSHSASRPLDSFVTHFALIPDHPLFPLDIHKYDRIWTLLSLNFRPPVISGNASVCRGASAWD